MLVELGRDCAGAVVLTPDDERPDDGSGGVQLLGDDELASAVDDLVEHPLGASPDVRVSLAGQQSKLLLTRDDNGRFGRAVGGAATNVQLKPEPMTFPGYAANEAFCMVLARNAGLTTVTVEVLQVAGRAVLVVPRYDRAERGDARTQRLHQEDTCQAMAVDCSGRDRKYERDGGPTLAKVAALLDRHGMPGDRRRLLADTAFNVAVGNADAHGKNLSVLHHPNGQAELAPMYDVSSTVQYESVQTPTGRRRLSTEMGMTVHRVRDVHHVTQDDLVAEALSWGLNRDDADRTVRRTLEDALAQLDRTRDALARTDAKLVDDVHDRCRALLAGLRADGLTPQNVTDPTTRQQVRSEPRERNGLPTLER